MSKIPVILQSDLQDCASACITMILTSFNVNVSLFELKLKYPASSNGISIKSITNIVENYGCTTKACKIDPSELVKLKDTSQAAILFVNDNHFVVLEIIKEQHVVLIDPLSGRKKLSYDELAIIWQGVVVFIESGSEKTIASRSNNFNNIFELLSIFKTKWIMYAGISIFAILINLAIPYLMGSVISSFIDEFKSPITLDVNWPYFVVAICCIVLSFWLKERVSITLRLLLDSTLTSKFVDKLFRLPLLFFNKYSTGDILNRVGSTSVMREFYTSNLVAAVLELLIVCALLIAVFFQSMYLGLLMSSIIAILVINIKFRWKSYRAIVREEVFASASNSDYLTDFLAGVNTIKSLAKEAVFYKRWGNNYNNYLEISKQVGIERLKMSSLHEVFGKSCPVIMLVVALTLYLVDELTQQSAFFVYFLLTWLCPSVISLANISIAYIHLTVHSERLVEFDHYVRQSQPSDAISINTVEANITQLHLKNLTFRYDVESNYMFKNVNLTIEQAGIHAITGASGSGKSTLLRLIANHLLPESGNVVLNGISEEVQQQISQQGLSYLGQSPYIFRGSVLDNLTMFNTNKQMAAEVVEMCKLVGLHFEIMNMPQQYQTVLEFNGANVSGGQKQRIALARLLLLNPPILILDECTNQLNSDLELKITKYLRERQGITLIVSHSNSWLEPQDNIYELRNRQIIKLTKSPQPMAEIG